MQPAPSNAANTVIAATSEPYLGADESLSEPVLFKEHDGNVRLLQLARSAPRPSIKNLKWANEVCGRKAHQPLNVERICEFTEVGLQRHSTVD